MSSSCSVQPIRPNHSAPCFQPGMRRVASSPPMKPVSPGIAIRGWLSRMSRRMVEPDRIEPTMKIGPSSMRAIMVAARYLRAKPGADPSRAVAALDEHVVPPRDPPERVLVQDAPPVGAGLELEVVPGAGVVADHRAVLLQRTGDDERRPRQVKRAEVETGLEPDHGPLGNDTRLAGLGFGHREVRGLATRRPPGRLPPVDLQAVPDRAAPDLRPGHGPDRPRDASMS